jgi:hypothetical protein
MATIMGRYRFRGKVEPLSDMPPINFEAPSPRPSGGPGSLVPACVLLKEDGSLELKPLDGALLEERELISRVCLCRYLSVEPRILLGTVFEPRPSEPETKQ